MMKLLQWLFTPLMFHVDPPGPGSVTAADARVVLSDFLPPDTVKSMDDKALLEHHGRFSAGIQKHYKAPNADPNKPWFDTFQDPETKEWLKSYAGAYPNAEAVAKKALHLERFVGVDKSQRGVVVPKPDAKPEEWTQFWRQVGAQEKVDGYKIPDTFKEDKVLAGMREHAHSIGMPTAHWEATVKWYEKAAKDAGEQDVAAFRQNAQADMNALRDAWGAGYDANMAKAKRAVNAFIPGADAPAKAKLLASIEGAIGTKATMEFFHSIGTKIGEHAFIGPDGVVNNEGGMTPEQAKFEIETLKADKEFGKKLLASDAASKKKWDELHVIAFGQKAA